jgi:hypothetical protein
MRKSKYGAHYINTATKMRAIIFNIGIEFGHCRRSTGSCIIAKRRQTA